MSIIVFFATALFCATASASTPTDVERKRALAAGRTFLLQNKLRERVYTTKVKFAAGTGADELVEYELQYEPVSFGVPDRASGLKKYPAADGDSLVYCHFEGRLANGDVFDASSKTQGKVGFCVRLLLQDE